MLAEGERSDPDAAPLTDPSLVHWWEARDPGLGAIKRSVRAAVLVPAVFALADFGIGDSQTTLFGVFGAFALLLFADFGGPPRVRLHSYLGLVLAGAALITAGTLCSSHTVAAVIGMAVFGFAVLFAGAVSPQAAVGSTAALLTFVLPVAVPAGATAVGSRLAGWALAAACCVPALMLVWPGRWHDPLRRKAADAARAVADLVDAHAEGRRDPPAFERAGHALDRLRAQYEATPYRPAGAGPTDTALVRLVSRLEWVGENALVPSEGVGVLEGDPSVRRVHLDVAEVLRQVAVLLLTEDEPGQSRAVDSLTAGVSDLRSHREALSRDAWDRLQAGREVAERSLADRSLAGGGRLLWELDPTYPIRILASATEMTAEMALGTVPDRAREGPGAGVRKGPVARVRESARATLEAASSRLTLRSVWFRNSLRGAAAMAVAVAVVEATDVQHGFWVVLGTLSVLRSNALGTGATALRAVAGTVAGVALGALVLHLLGHHLDLLWAVLPFAVLLAGVAPSAISFAAGQAGFTVSVVIIFNILEPVGSVVGLIRIEDVAIGVVVSMVVGSLFWPRGASAELARSLCEAYAGAVAWLAAEVRRLDRADPGPAGPDPVSLAIETADRLDDAFRQFMNERGAKRIPLPTLTHLVTGCSKVRLVALTLRALPHPPAVPATAGSDALAAARRGVVAALTGVERWYEASARALGGHRTGMPVLEPPDDALRPRLVAALDEALTARRPDQALTALRLVWLLMHLGDLHELQVDLVSAYTS